MIADLMRIPYLRGGMTEAGADCWGLALLVRRRLGRPSPPTPPPASAYDDPRQNRLVFDSAMAWVAVTDDPQPGAFAAVMHRAACRHVGVVVDIDGRRCVLETEVLGGVRWYTLDDFLSLHAKVVFYDDIANLPERAER